MPHKNSRNRASELRPFHVYNRGARGRAIFKDDHDRREFLWMLKRHLSRADFRDRRSRKYARVDGVELLAFCLMTTHFHLVVWQRGPGAMDALMHRVLAAYVRYFRRRHGGRGPLFSGPFRARPLRTPKEFMWAIAYVHDNHPTGPGYRFSSHRAYLGADDCPPWLNAEAALKPFGDAAAYRAYMDLKAARAQLDAELF